MKRVLCPILPKLGQSIELDPTEAKHLTTVLRAREGDEIELLNGAGQKSQGVLSIQGKKIAVTGTSQPVRNAKLNALPIHLKVAILKGDAMEWVIEKAVELGVKSITPLLTDYTVVQVQKKGIDAFLERWQKIADQALKQCGRLERIHFHEPVSLLEAFIHPPYSTFWLDESLAEEGRARHHLQNELSSHARAPIGLLVGPEGGFSPAERERLFQLTGHSIHEINKGEANKQVLIGCHLGSLVLRAETAALMGISLIAGKLGAFEHGTADPEAKDSV